MPVSTIRCGGGGEPDALHGHVAPACRQEARDDAQERRLAGAVRADHRDRLAGLDRHRHVEQRLEAAIAGVDVAEHEHRRI